MSSEWWCISIRHFIHQHKLYESDSRQPITLVGKICKHAKQSRRSKTLQRRPSTPLQIIIADEGLIKQETSLIPASDHSVVSYLPRSTSFCLRPCQSTVAATVWDIGHSRSPLDGSPCPILLEHDRVGTALQQEKQHVYCTSSTPYAATACSIIGSTIALTPVPTTIVMVGHKQRRLIQDLVTTPSHLELDDMFNGGGIVCENSATKYLDDTTVEFSHPPGYSGIQSGAGRLTHANSYDDIAKIGSLKATPSMRLDEFLENTLFAGLDTPYDMRYEQGCPSEMTVPSLQY
ncbi:hypothetical protein BASA50_000518 [Batrachochytrium salamandrivorans]|uniref:Uncharacterized protein n=1 Tax=Batrachochytrium salamandrivorans TaxID=1357716 RepID=A0ABQ8EUG1_9FUNG|nr:hypothetical protein BASA50_000518 [Batrachochytrium salamandrivorans]